MLFFQSVIKLFDGLVRPTRLLAAGDLAEFRATIERALLVVLLALSFILFTVSALNWSAIREAEQSIGPALSARSGAESGSSPVWRFFFPLLWLMFIAYYALVRQGAVRLFGDSGLRFREMFACSAFALTPAIVCGGLAGVWNALVPLSLSAGNPESIQIRLYLVLVTTLFAFIWEGWLAIQTFRRHLKQNAGRAALTWLAPLIFLFLFFFLAGRLIDLFAPDEGL